MATLTQADLTLKGVLATEISEGHALLMSSLYLSGLLKDASGPEVICVLSCMLEGKDGGKEEGTLDVRQVFGATEAVVAAYGFLQAEARRGMEVEAWHGVPSPTKFWELQTMWMDVAARWTGGQSVPEICAEFDIFEGNLLRGLMKMNTLLTEWMTLASFCEVRRRGSGRARARVQSCTRLDSPSFPLLFFVPHLRAPQHPEVLDKLRDAPQCLLRDIAVTESLYVS